jgi:hypothetical protein
MSENISENTNDFVSLHNCRCERSEAIHYLIMNYKL